MEFTEKLIDSIDNRIRDLAGEITSLEAARASLTANGHAPAPAPEKSVKRRRRSKPKARATPKSKPKRRTEVLLADRAELLLGETDGLTTAELAKQADADRDQVLTLLRELEQRARVRRTGQRRGTRWHAITDEDRIQKRATELAKRTRRRPT